MTNEQAKEQTHKHLNELQERTTNTQTGKGFLPTGSPRVLLLLLLQAAAYAVVHSLLLLLFESFNAAAAAVAF